MIAGDPVMLHDERTIHRVASHLTVVPDAIVTLCGMRGMPHVPNAGALQHLRKCRACRIAIFEKESCHERP